MRKASLALALVASLSLMLGGGGSASADPGATGLECPAGTAAITGLSFSVNGNPASTSGLVIQGVSSGDTVVASFTVAPGCTGIPLNFSGYKAVANVANAGNVGLQTLASNASGTFDAGARTLTLTVPNCFFQIDLYRGPLVTQWNPLSLLSFFSAGSFNSGSAQRQMLGNATGGTSACQATTVNVNPVPTTTVPTTTITTPNVTLAPVAPTVVAGVQTQPAPVVAAVPAAVVTLPAAVVASATTERITAAPVTQIAALPSTSTAPRQDLPAALGLAFIVLGALQLRRSAARAR